MKTFLTGVVVAGAMAFGVVGSATAATLSFDGTPNAALQALPDNFDPLPISGQMYSDHAVWKRATAENTTRNIVAATTSGDQFANGTGVSLHAGAAKVTVTYLGSEADNKNTFFVNDEAVFDNRSAAFGDQRSAVWTGGAVDFGFCTERAGKPDRSGCVGNAGSHSGHDGDLMYVSFSDVFTFNGKDTVLVFFGDGLGDSDLDDMVLALSVEPLNSVPLPAGMLLLGSAAIGLGVAGRRRRRKA